MKTTLYDKNGNMIVAIESSNPVKSSEGFVDNFKQNWRFMSLWDSKIKNVARQLGFSVNSDDLKLYDYKQFYAARKSNKTLTAEQYIQELLNNKYNASALKKLKDEERDAKRKQERSLPPEIENVLKQRIENFANKALTITKSIINHVKTDANIKKYFNDGKSQNSDYSGLNYLDYICDIPTKEKIIDDIKYSVKMDLSRGKAIGDIKLDYIIYIVDMFQMREDWDDIYDNFGNEDLYDVFYNNIPKINANPYDIDFGGYGWESITATLYEK